MALWLMEITNVQVAILIIMWAVFWIGRAALWAIRGQQNASNRNASVEVDTTEHSDG